MKIYAFPGKDEFLVGLSSDIGNWGYSEPDYSLDLFRTKVPVVSDGSITEQHTIEFLPTQQGAELVMSFEKVMLRIPILLVER
ncbi:MAG TPA: hypothetical protein DCS15_09780 [Flavobacteriales bacterium]|nr:hypothetical protein [Flavobacteriales bacterium]